jgi:hypothetical protein
MVTAKDVLIAGTVLTGVAALAARWSRDANPRPVGPSPGKRRHPRTRPTTPMATAVTCER